MTQILRQSTQVVVRIGPAVAVANGYVPVTTLDLSTADEAELLKAAGAATVSIAAATFAAITGADGWYDLTLTTSHTDTIGTLDVVINDDSLCLPIHARFQVIEEAAYDAIYAASADPKADVNVASIDANAITATAIADGAIDAATFAAGAITASAIAADAIGASELAADAVAEIADAIWDEDATAHQTGGTFGQAIGDPGADTTTIYQSVVTDAAGANIAADIAAIEAQTDDIGAAGAGLTALPWNAAWDAEVQSEAEDALVAHRLDELLNADSDIDGAAPPTVGSVFHELMSKTAGSFTFDQTTDSSEAVRDAITTPPTAAAIADQVWEEAIADHSATAGSTAEQLAAAGAAGDPWATAVPGAYGAGTAGNILGNNLNATVSSRASAADMATALTYIDTEVAAILADTNELQVDWVNGGRLDLLIDAIKAKTDNLPASPAAVGSAMTLTSGERDAVAAALLDLAAGVETGLTPRQALRLMAAAVGGKLSGGGTGTETFRNAVADDANRIVATVDASGNRSAITYNL